jgi:hypothetical protein
MAFRLAGTSFGGGGGGGGSVAGTLGRVPVFDSASSVGDSIAQIAVAGAGLSLKVGGQFHIVGLEAGKDCVFNHVTDDSGNSHLEGGRATSEIHIGEVNTGGIFIGGSGTGSEVSNRTRVRGRLTAGEGDAGETQVHDLIGQTGFTGGSYFNYVGDLSHDTYIRAGASGARVRIGDNANDVFLMTSGKTTRVLGRLMVDEHVGFYGTTPIAKPAGVAVTAAAVHAALVALGLIAP